MFAALVPDTPSHNKLRSLAERHAGEWNERRRRTQPTIVRINSEKCSLVVVGYRLRSMRLEFVLT